MTKKTVLDLDTTDARVLVRVDFNVPLGDGGNVLDDLRIRSALPTVNYLREQRARVILCSHLGRPKGRVVESLRLAPIAPVLSRMLDSRVVTTKESMGPEVESAAARLAAADVLLLENVRFHAEEEANDPAFARKLASLASLFVNDAFGAAHRAHASTEGVTHYLPSVAGLLMERELTYLDRVVANPERPVGAIIGGAKVGDKMAVLKRLLTLTDVLVIGGGMANTFIKAQGLDVGDSLVEDDQLEAAREILDDADRRGVQLLLPVDVVVGDAFSAEAASQVVSSDAVPHGWRIMDVGEASIALYVDALAPCKTIVWNGPLGVAEFEQFARGSRSLADALARIDAVKIVGGGETAALVRGSGLEASFDHISTGGGAFLEFLEGRELPGVAALLDA